LEATLDSVDPDPRGSLFARLAGGNVARDVGRFKRQHGDD